MQRNVGLKSDPPLSAHRITQLADNVINLRLHPERTRGFSRVRKAATKVAGPDFPLNLCGHPSVNNRIVSY